MVTELDQSYLSSTACVASDREGGREGWRIARRGCDHEGEETEGGKG